MTDDKQKPGKKSPAEEPEVYLLETDIYGIEKSAHRSSSDKQPPEKSRKTTNKNSLWYALFQSHRPLEKETALFILVSTLDFYMTWMLLSRHNNFVESNPVARFFINHWGPRGLIYFKFSLVAVVCMLTQIIAMKKLETARRVLQFAIIVVGGVVIYSLTLLLRHG